MSGLKRTLRLGEVIFFASGVILGAGIYAVVGKAAGSGGNMLWLSFCIAALTAVLSLFAYAELSSMYPRAGGEFAYVQESVGRKWAYAVGLMVSLSGMISSATIAIGFAGYLSELLDVPSRLAAIGIIVFIWLVNTMGIRHSSVVNIVFTVIETGGLLYVIYAAAPSVGERDLTELPPSGIHGLLTGAAICFFAFTGFEDTVKLAEETKQPEKTIPKALFISAAIIVLLYIAVSISVVSMIPFEELASSDKPFSTVMEKRFGQKGAIIIAVIALFSTSNSLLSNMLGASRVLFHIGEKSPKVKFLSVLLPKRKTPVFALVVAASVAMAFSLIGEVRRVALITNFFMFLTFLIMNAVVIYLRVKKADAERPFRIPLSVKNIPLPSLLAMVMVLVLMAYTVYGLASGQAE